MTTSLRQLRGTHWLLVSILVLSFFFPLAAKAALTITPTGFPLNISNMLPGSTASGTITLQNGFSDTYNAAIAPTNITDDDGLSQAMTLVIQNGGSNHYNGDFHSFLTGGPHGLGTIGAGNAKTYTFTLTLNHDASQELYEGTSVAFDLVVGFTEPIISSPPGSTTGGPGSTGGSSRGRSNSSSFVGGSGGGQQPAGLIAGANTSTPPPPPTFVSTMMRPIVSLVEGLVLGETAEAETGQAEEDLIDSSESTSTDPESVTANTVVDLIKNADCVFLWLLLLILISFSWSLFEDRLSNKYPVFVRFFKQNTIFTGLYILALIAALTFGILESIWWLFAGAWTAMVTFDYREHLTAAVDWSTKQRNLYYAGTALAIIVIGLFTSAICTLWPFIAVLVVSAILFIFSE